MMMHRRGLAFPQLKWTRIATHRYVRKVGSQPHIGCQGHPGSMFIEGMVWSEFAHTNARPNKLILIGVRVIIVVICPECWNIFVVIWYLTPDESINVVFESDVCICMRRKRIVTWIRPEEIQPDTTRTWLWVKSHGTHGRSHHFIGGELWEFIAALVVTYGFNMAWTILSTGWWWMVAMNLAFSH